MPRIKLYASLILIAALAVSSCGGDDDSVTYVAGTTYFEFVWENLDSLDNGYYYEAWALIENYAYSLGKFNINSTGNMIDTTGEIIKDNVLSYDGVPWTYFTAIGVTIQELEDSTVSSRHFLGGTVTDDAEALLSVDHEAGVNADLSGAAGSYILGTPTDGANTNETSGIWFIDKSVGIPTAGLDLPELEAEGGWIYEGWIKVNDKYYSTGTFYSTTTADDTSRYGSTEQLGHPYPGEDFLINAPSELTFPLDLRGKHLMVTLEPEDDFDPDNPMGFILLEAQISTIASEDYTYQMTSMVENTLPTCSVGMGTTIDIADEE